MPVFVGAQADTASTIPGLGVPQAEIPETIDEAVKESKELGEEVSQKLPNAVRKIWDNEVIPFWQNMFNWIEEKIWGNFLEPVVQDIIDRFKNFSEERRPILEQELEKEKEELKEGLREGASQAKESLWQRFLDLFRDDASEVE